MWFAFLCVQLSVFAEQASRRPNVIVMIADDLGYGELGCYGGDLPTPNLDALAARGVRCTSGYVTAPFCAASRAALITGRMQTRFGFEFNPIGAQNAEPGMGLPANEQTLAELLRDQGYATALIGKWHLGGTPRFHPQRRGFDHFFGFLHEGHYYVPPPWSQHVTWLRRRAIPDSNGSHGDRWHSSDGRTIWTKHMGGFEPDYDADNPILRNSQPVTLNENLTDALTRETEEFITRHRDQPFCAVVAYNAVHSPMQAHDRFYAQFKHIEDVHRRIFASMLAHLDDGVGRICTRLNELDLSQKTLLVFLSDNGGPTRELTSNNRPLRGDKGQLLEGGIRVPFLVCWPGVFAPGRVEHRPISSLDIAATLAGTLSAKPKKPLDGVNWQSYMHEQTVAPRQPLYWRVGAQAALRSGDWKLYRTKQSGAKWQLYHLAQDIEESNDLAEKEPAKLSSLVAEWETLDRQMIEPLWR